jgi:hypothetical protein
VRTDHPEGEAKILEHGGKISLPSDRNSCLRTTSLAEKPSGLQESCRNLGGK